ncbi:F-box domain [Macleaya cordata]|uniref:F-box domain n=1 Tax=Macleaya cordata TaxID=56857 RepID=A0A200R982_MACCD|nr:F-box domain [Macleaya cordata]
MLLSLTDHQTTNDEISGENLVHESSSSSSSVIASNFDILIQILLCLPLKSLGVFKSVSKQWLSLISDPYFVRNHRLRNQISISGLFLPKSSLFKPGREYELIFLDGNITSGIPVETLNFGDDPASIPIDQSCNGLFCCSSSSRNFRTKVFSSTYYIYNPFTKHYRILPPSQFRENAFVSSSNVSLAFDPLKSPYYEAICMWRDDKYNFQIEIYSSKTDSWRLSGDTFPAPMGLYYKSGVYWNGSLHWINMERNIAVYFDIDQELVKRMPLPSVSNGYWENGRFAYFGESRGHLQLIDTYDPNPTRFDILEMETDYTGWTTKYHVDLEGVLIAYPEIDRDRFEFSILLVQEEEESSKLVLQILNNMVIISYDPKDMSVKKIHDVLPVLEGGVSSRMKYGYYSTYPYTETLARV